MDILASKDNETFKETLATEQTLASKDTLQLQRNLNIFQLYKYVTFTLSTKLMLVSNEARILN